MWQSPIPLCPQIGRQFFIQSASCDIELEFFECEAPAGVEIDLPGVTAEGFFVPDERPQRIETRCEQAGSGNEQCHCAVTCAPSDAGTVARSVRGPAN